MRRILYILVVLLLLAIGAGCADFKTYMRDRGNDLADCFTARAGVAFGAGARAQFTNYLSVSVGGSWEMRKVGYYGRTPVDTKGMWLGIPCLQILSPRVFFADVDSDPMQAILGLFLVATDLRGYEEEPLPGGLWLFGFLRWGSSDEGEPSTPFLRKEFFIEAGATLGVVGFDFGFNPVEFIDFLLGWTTLDITGDDAVPEAKQEAQP